jgi:hypothetical protein
MDYRRLAIIIFIAVTLQGCCTLFGLNCAVVNYPISGTVTVLNECNNNTPNQITLNLTLVNGNQEVGTTVVVPLINGVGQYNSSVGWSGGVPLSWKRVTAAEVCPPMPCDDPTMRCLDFRTETPTFPIGNPTVKDVVFNCACSQ